MAANADERTPPAATSSILVINSGSSSLKAALFTRGSDEQAERLLLEANATGIGQSEGKLVCKDFRDDPQGEPLAEDKHNYKSQTEALARIAEALRERAGGKPVAVGHRLVHGGMHLTRHQRINPALLAQLEQAVHFAPLHIPGSLELIRKAIEIYPGVPQIACFDTAFHQTLPEEAWRLPIPRGYTEAGVRRYGFHGLSYESIVSQLQQQGPALPGRIVVAHLGSGASLCAIARGHSVDTSMGFTPTGGIPMATRTGDLDPGVLIALMRPGLLSRGQPGAGGLSVDDLEWLINHECGLEAISSGISDMQQIEEAASNPGEGAARRQAALALSIFATAVAKTIASYIVSLAGLDLLVFTGGIGEHSAPVRAAVVERLHPLGMRLDAGANASAPASVISAPASRVPIRILPAQEDLEIARHTRTLLAQPA